MLTLGETVAAMQAKIERLEAVNAELVGAIESALPYLEAMPSERLLHDELIVRAKCRAALTHAQSPHGDSPATG